MFVGEGHTTGSFHHGVKFCDSPACDNMGLHSSRMH